MIRTGPNTLGWNSTVVRKTLGAKQAIKLVFASAATPNARDFWECSRSEELPQSASTSTRHVEQLEYTSHHPARADHQFGHTGFEGSTNGGGTRAMQSLDPHPNSSQWIFQHILLVQDAVGGIAAQSCSE